MPYLKHKMRAYLNNYLRQRYATRLREAQQLLGGKCTQCSATTRLEFDHIDKTTKTFSITTRLRSAPWPVIEDELKKCQLLCRPHHIEKTVRERWG